MMPSPSMLKQQERNWLDLPNDVTINILNRIGIVDILENAQKVCTHWRKICKDPTLWRVIKMNKLVLLTSNLSTAKIICKHAMDRSQGQLVDLTLICDNNAELFFYAVERCSQLRRLELASGGYYGSLTTDALMKFPLLEELNLYAVKISKEEIKTLGRYCPMLKTLKVNYEFLMGSNETAIAIGQNLVELRHLELIGNKMTNNGLEVILDNCHHLETLDLRRCFNIDLKGDLGEKCSKQIKHLKFPGDSLEGCPYFHEIVSEPSDDEDYFDYNNGPYNDFGLDVNDDASDRWVPSNPMEEYDYDLYCDIYGGY